MFSIWEKMHSSEINSLFIMMNLMKSAALKQYIAANEQNTSLKLNHLQKSNRMATDMLQMRCRKKWIYK